MILGYVIVVVWTWKLWAWWKAGMSREAGANFGEGDIARIGRWRGVESRSRFILLGIRSDVVQQLLNVYFAI
jgi:hypothetical protein